MARVRDLLYRFRPAGTPGAASSAGVPADRGADLAAELEPLFAELAGTQRECAAIVSSARQEAGLARTRDQDTARSLVTAAREHLESERADAASQLRQREEPDAALAAAEHEAADLRRRATQRIPACVDRVVASVRDLIGEEQSTSQPTVVGT